jgi:hypothetical protein
MEDICRFCERLFTADQIQAGVPLPTFRGQHFRLVEIDGTVHKFQSVRKKKKIKGETR